MKALGIEFTAEDELNAAFVRFKDLADKKHEIFDEDLQAIVTDRATEQSNERVRFVKMSIASETGEAPRAKITLTVDGEEKSAQATGDGVVDAAFRAVEAVAPTVSELLLYSVNNITSGTDAQGEVSVRLQQNGRVVNGQGSDTDIVAASVKAYINALNKLQDNPSRQFPQVGDTP